MTELDIQRYDRRLKSIRKRFETINISTKNKELIHKYVHYRAAEGLSKARQIMYYERLWSWAKIFQKDFDQISKDDVIQAVSDIRTRNYTSNTLHTCLTVLKAFMRFVYPQEDGEYPKVVRWLRVRAKTDKVINPLELWTEEDMKKILDRPLYPRDKAFIVALFESGCRISELGNTTIGSVAFDEYGCVLTTGKSKTFVRPMRLVAAAPYLSQWINMHPRQNDPNAPLWMAMDSTESGKLMSYEALRKTLKLAAEGAGIKKKCNPHWLRHSRQTILAGIMTHAQQCAYAGWKQGSSMPQVYIHLSQNGVEDPLLAYYGITKAEKATQSLIKPLKCPKCSRMNILTALVCGQCQAPLKQPVTKAITLQAAPVISTGEPKALDAPPMFGDRQFQQMMVEFMRTCLQSAANKPPDSPLEKASG